MNWASSRTNRAASENSVTTSQRALATGLPRVMQHSASLLVGEHAVGAAPARRERPVLAALFLGVLHRHLRPPQMAEGERHALERGAEVGRLGAGPLHDLHADGHVSSAPEPLRPPPDGPDRARTAAAGRAARSARTARARTAYHSSNPAARAGSRSQWRSP